MDKEKSTPSILIIDDDAFLLDMYALKFSQKGFEVVNSPGTLQALEKLHAGKVPDVLLVDLVMPIMDGFTFLEQVQKENLAPQALIVVLSNLGQQEDIDRALQLGAAGYIIKASATPSEVVTRVQEELKKHKKKS